ncbi:MAG TPA: ArsC/Spx/MgsR family protein [Marmoricola sp.]
MAAEPLEIWINPSCSKCRAATAELDAAGVAYVERRYLDDPPTVAELGDVLARLGVEPWHLARPVETREAGIDLPRDADHRDDWIEAMVANPRTIQRPIITATDGTTVVARDPGTLAAVVERERPAAGPGPDQP